ncbi:hypothetical protein HIM_00537 [Hirsutella minnesotensis 3608]|nr:hypothetical protein HIM_00537 [Hirsutella minnesotensis 3608]
MLVAKGLSARHIRPSNFLLAALVIAVFFHLSRHWKQRQHRSNLISTNETWETSPSAQEEYLKRLADTYNLTNQTRWQVWRVQSQPSRNMGNGLTHVRSRFGTEPETIVDLHNPSSSKLDDSNKITLPVQGVAETTQLDASEFLFGVSTSYKRIADKNWALLRSWERWLTDGKRAGRGAGIVLLLDKATDKELQDIGDRLEARGLDAHLVSTNEPMSMAKRYHELVRIFKTYSATLAASGHEKKWFGLVEDTVFFPDLSYLRERLSAHDATDELYLGLTGEHRDWHVDGSNMTAYGGGTVLLTRQAIERIPRLPCLQTEKSKLPIRPKRWDTLLQGCVKRYAGLDMRIIAGAASQAENSGDDVPQSTGSDPGTRPLVLRGYQDRYDVDVGMAHLVTDICGESCFMQQFVFRDDWVLVNGLSLTHYRDGFKQHLDDGKQTREGGAGTNSSKQGTGDQDAQKTIVATPDDGDTWRLLDSAPAMDGSVWQAYLKRGTKGTGTASGGEAGELDSLMILVWERVAQ